MTGMDQQTQCSYSNGGDQAQQYNDVVFVEMFFDFNVRYICFGLGLGPSFLNLDSFFASRRFWLLHAVDFNTRYDFLV